MHHHNAQHATMSIDQLGDLDHEKLITAGLLLQGVRGEGGKEDGGGMEGNEAGAKERGERRGGDMTGAARKSTPTRLPRRLRRLCRG